MEKAAAIYARVSSDRQKENHTIQSQTAALTEYARRTGTRFPRNGSSKAKASPNRRMATTQKAEDDR